MIHIFLSWLSATLLLLLASIWPLRKIIAKYKLPKEHPLRNAHQWLRKRHKVLGFGVIGVVLVHCRIAEYTTANSGGIGHGMLAILVLLVLSWIIRKPLKRHWLVIHRSLAILLFILGVCHSFFKF